MKKRFLSMLVLLAAVATGAWAQTETLLTTITPTAKEQASYSTANVATVSFSYTAYGSSAYKDDWGWWGYGWIATVTAAEGYTITKCIFYDDANRTATDSKAPFVVETTEEDKTPRINETPIDGGNMWSKGIKKIEVYGYVTPTYGVTLAEGTEDGGKWTIEPNTGLKGGETVIASYSGDRKVKSVKAVKKAAPIIDLSTLTADYEAKDGETLTGTLASNVKISIADGATVTLKDVNITNLGNNCNWAGINCPGDATLVLEGTNTVCAGRASDGYNNYPGIWIAPDKTLTIQGDGTLTAYSNDINPWGAGIGGGYQINCGNIVISGGNITATGGKYGTGIGGGRNGSCGNITISGGTVTAAGGESAAGIGGGRTNGACGTITITKGVTSVKATKGEGAPNSIGAGLGGADITVNIEDGANVTLAPVTVTWNSLNFNTNPYTRDGVTLTISNNSATGNNFYSGGDKTFTNTIGKFTKIEIVCEGNNFNGWAKESAGGYQIPEGPYVEVFKLTWTGNAESVTIPGGNYLYGISSITFNIQ